MSPPPPNHPTSAPLSFGLSLNPSTPISTYSSIYRPIDRYHFINPSIIYVYLNLCVLFVSLLPSLSRALSPFHALPSPSFRHRNFVLDDFLCFLSLCLSMSEVTLSSFIFSIAFSTSPKNLEISLRCPDSYLSLSLILSLFVFGFSFFPLIYILLYFSSS